MIESKDLIRRAERAHDGRLTEQECRQLCADLDSVIEAGNQRLVDLDYDGITREPHPARAAALAEGVEAVMAADDEVRELTATLQMLEHHLSLTQKAQDAAHKREAAGKAKEAIKALPAAARRVAKARTELAEADAALSHYVAQLSEARGIADNCPVLTVETFAEIADQAWPISNASDPAAVARLRRDMHERLTGVREPRVERWVGPNGVREEIVA